MTNLSARLASARMEHGLGFTPCLFGRSIQYAFDNIEGKVIDLEKLIASQKEGFEVRNLYNSDLSRFTCIECEQRLTTPHSSKDNVYFRHFRNSKDCVLKDSTIDPELLLGYKTIAFAREGPRHIYLKNKIGELLKSTEGIDLGSIDIDSKFIIGNGGHKRRPDVYCEYQGHKLAFEIQISYLPLHYIKHRYQFYKENGIYLIWIIDFFNSAKDLSTFQRDIKYIWPHQNLFKLDETQDIRLLLDCHYKQPFIHYNQEVREKWTVKKVQFNDLKFSQENYTCYYLHYINEYQRTENQVKQLKEKIALDKLEQQKQARKQEVNKQVDQLVSKIKNCRSKDYNFYSLVQSVKNLSEDCIEVLNSKINLDRKLNGVPLFLIFIKEYKVLNTETKVTVVEFLLSCLQLRYNIAATDAVGNGVIQYLYGNPALSRYIYHIRILIFIRGYKVCEADRDYLTSTMGREGVTEFYELSYYSACDSLEEIRLVKNLSRFLLFVDSAKTMHMIGSNLKSWVSYMVNLMNRYPDYWIYMVMVLKKTNLGAELKRTDKKGTIARKIKEFNLEEVDCEPEVYLVFMKVHPDIFVY